MTRLSSLEGAFTASITYSFALMSSVSAVFVNMCPTLLSCLEVEIFHSFAKVIASDNVHFMPVNLFLLRHVKG